MNKPAMQKEEGDDTENNDNETKTRVDASHLKEVQVGKIETPTVRSDRRAATRPKTASVHSILFFFHWFLVILLITNLVTGMRLGWGYIDSVLGGAEGTWGAFLNWLGPNGGVLDIHIISSWLMVFVTVGYIAYVFYSKNHKRLIIKRSGIKAITTALRDGEFWKNNRSLWATNQLLYWLAFISVVLLLFTGIAMYKHAWHWDIMLGGYSVARLIHAIIAYLMVFYIVAHILVEYVFGTFWNIFIPTFSKRNLKAGSVGIAVGIVCCASYYFAIETNPALTAPKIAVTEVLPKLDGVADDAIWNKADPITVTTVKGANQPQGKLDITVKALHDGKRIYFLFQWPDPARSSKRYPLLKTEAGWKMLGTRFELSDELNYYEDKLAVHFTHNQQSTCAETCHHGISGGIEGAKATWGLHYTTNGDMTDVWHWKSVRTNQMRDRSGEPGFMDDQHFGPPTEMKPGKRYTGGYHADPKSGGGYRYNFKKLNPDLVVAEGFVEPVKFPAKLQTATNSLDFTEHDEGIWWINDNEGIPYSAATDTYSVGTLIPNILIEPFEGDRADVSAKGVWKEGVWTLEASRALDTSSEYDVAFIVGKPIYVSFSVYNHVQTRHTEHLHSVELQLEP